MSPWEKAVLIEDIKNKNKKVVKSLNYHVISSSKLS